LAGKCQTFSTQFDYVGISKFDIHSIFDQLSTVKEMLRRKLNFSKNFSTKLSFVNRTANGQFVDVAPDKPAKSVMMATQNSGDVLRHKLKNIQSVYEETTGLVGIKVAQQKVIECQEKLKVAQEARRQIAIEQTQIRQQLQEIHSQIQRCNRGEPRYLELVQIEFDLMQKDREKAEHFVMADNSEREIFTQLKQYTFTSHEKEKIYAEGTKYWSVIGTMVGAAIGVFGTLISYYYRNNQFKQMNATLINMEQHFQEDTKKIYGFIEKLYEREAAVKDKRKLSSVQSQESWTGYLTRKTFGAGVSVYRYFVPKRT
jgi:hypothetical protein